MPRLRELAKFGSGVAAWESVAHLSLLLSGQTPTVAGFTLTPTLNLAQAVLGALASAALAWLGWRRKEPPAPATPGAPGGYIHFDLVSKDPDATRRFYETVFGWSFQRIPLAGYSLARPGAPPNGGLRKPEAGEQPSMLGYVAVASLDDAAARIAAAGGRLVGKRQKVPGFGAFVLFEAPGGIVQGAFEEKR